MAARASVKLKKQAAKPIPIEQRIRQRAYEIYLQRDGREGTALDDWLQAETEITHTVEQIYVHRAESATSSSRE
jgi:Protein of unknown function (DUF2934)